MALVTWTATLETGIAVIDADHRLLVNLLNQADGCIDQNEDSSVLGSILNGLSAYTAHHFAREERLMTLAAYGGFNDHIALHRELSATVADMVAAFLADRETVGARAVRDFLLDWLTDHIMVSDFAYRDACRNQRAAIAEVTAMGMAPSSPTPSGRPLSSLTVLAVEDNPNFRRFLATVLRTLALARVQVVGAAEDALAAMARSTFDVVLCDCLMDGMDGFAFAAEAARLAPRTRIVFLTGRTDSATRRRAEALGVRTVIEKPMTVRGLVEALQAAAA